MKFSTIKSCVKDINKILCEHKFESSSIVLYVLALIVMLSEKTREISHSPLKIAEYVQAFPYGLFLKVMTIDHWGKFLDGHDHWADRNLGENLP